jgi:hypothetical protein
VSTAGVRVETTTTLRPGVSVAGSSGAVAGALAGVAVGKPSSVSR